MNTSHLLSEEREQSPQKVIVLYCLVILIFLIIGKVNQRLADFSRIWKANTFKEGKMHTKKNTKTSTKRHKEIEKAQNVLP